MKPRVNNNILSSGHSATILSFSMKEGVIHVVTNKSLFESQNILVDPKNSVFDPPYYQHYGEVNSGTWFKAAKEKEFTQPNPRCIPFYHFIDGLAVDKYGKLTAEAVLIYCLWFNKKFHTRAST